MNLSIVNFAVSEKISEIFARSWIMKGNKITNVVRKIDKIKISDFLATWTNAGFVFNNGMKFMAAITGNMIIVWGLMRNPNVMKRPERNILCLNANKHEMIIGNAWNESICPQKVEFANRAGLRK